MISSASVPASRLISSCIFYVLLFVQASATGWRSRFSFRMMRIASCRIGPECWIVWDFRPWRDGFPQLGFLAGTRNLTGSMNYCSLLLLWIKLLLLEGTGRDRDRGKDGFYRGVCLNEKVYIMSQLSRSTVELSSRFLWGSLQKFWLDSKMNLLSFFGTKSALFCVCCMGLLIWVGFAAYSSS